MDNTRQMEAVTRKGFIPLFHLLPAFLTLGLVLITLPMTRPVMARLPERLTAELLEKGTQPDGTGGENLEPIVDADYKDGVYKGSAQGYGGLITVQVTVEGGRITAVDILSADGETASFFNRAKGVIESVLTHQTWEVDVISGATYSSRGILGAIQNALTGEKVENEEPKTETPVGSLVSTAFEEPADGYRDGTYYGVAAGFGGTIQVRVVISGGQIAAIDIVSAPGETASYLSRAEAVIGSMLAANSPNVDTVSGATYSSNGIINAVKQALAQASGSKVDLVSGTPDKPDEPDHDDVWQPGTNIPNPSVTYRDGVYLGTGEGFGGDITVRVTVAGGKITSVEIVSAENETPAYLNRASVLLDRMIMVQGTQVDVISGATYSSNGILDGAKAALAQAMVSEDKPGEPETPPGPSEDEQPNLPGTDPKPGETDGPQEEVVYKDGSYTASALCTDEDLFSYRVQMVIVVTDGKISDVTVEKLEDTSDDPEANETYLSYAVNGRTRKNVWYEGVVNQILTKQSADEIDIVSSATYSSTALMMAAQEALQGAKLDDAPSPGPGEETPGEEKPGEGTSGEEKPGEENPGEETPGEEIPGEEIGGEDPSVPGQKEPDHEQDKPIYLDGSYLAAALCTDEDLFCYWVQITVTVADGEIFSIEVEKQEDTSEDPETNEIYLDYALNGRTRKNIWYEGVANQIFAAQSADAIDIVSGATYSSEAITAAVQEALQYASVEAES